MDPAQLQPGFKLDRYELLCPLAYGGMASVWLARFGGRRGFERLVVVKMILPQFSQDPRFQEMFLDEARIASRIEHGNVARILDVGEQDESTFIVMEWVDGDSLSKVLRAAEQAKSRIPAGIALRICADAAAGLHAAHTLKDRETGAMLGVVHRDVSPQNILISNSGSTVIIDFGVAKARDRVAQDTSAGQLKGKIRYMAPEQALGRSVDHRADVWSLGAILYEMFAGDAPYDGPNEVATLHKLTSGATPPPLPDSVPKTVRAVIDRALAYDADNRYATALELNLALETAMVEIGEPASVAVVAHYTENLLTERKAARKRAVDGALASARAREADPSAPLSSARGLPPTSAAAPLGIDRPSGPGHDRPSAPNPRSLSIPTGPQPIFAAPPQGYPPPDPPSFSSGPFGMHEAPSATSSATLGSGAMEYRPAAPPEHEDDDARRKRRYATAAILGVAMAAGLVGATLIIVTAVSRTPGRLGSSPDETPDTVTTAMTATPTTTSTDDGTPPPADTTGATTAGATTTPIATTTPGATTAGATTVGVAATATTPLTPASDPAPAATPKPLERPDTNATPTRAPAAPTTRPSSTSTGSTSTSSKTPPRAPPTKPPAAPTSNRTDRGF